MRRTYRLNENAVQMALEFCCSCGTPFGVEATQHANLVLTGKTFYCPNGHPQSYTESEIDRLKRLLVKEAKQRERAETRNRQLREENERLERSRRALRGVVTRTKNQIARGECPCCGAYFADLHSHMQTEHPDYEQHIIEDDEQQPTEIEGEADERTDVSLRPDTV